MIAWKTILQEGERVFWPSVALAAAVLPSLEKARPEWTWIGGVASGLAALIAFERTNPRNAAIMDAQQVTIEKISAVADKAIAGNIRTASIAAADQVKK
jgi:hypothetical protein